MSAFGKHSPFFDSFCQFLTPYDSNPETEPRQGIQGISFRNQNSYLCHLTKYDKSSETEPRQGIQRISFRGRNLYFPLFGDSDPITLKLKPCKASRRKMMKNEWLYNYIIFKIKQANCPFVIAKLVLAGAKYFDELDYINIRYQAYCRKENLK